MVKFSFTESSANHVDTIQAVQAKPSGRPKRQGFTSQFHSPLGLRRTVWSSTAVVVAETSDCCADTGRRPSRLSLDLCIPMRSHSALTCAICRWNSMQRSRSTASYHQHLHGASQTQCNACGSSISISCYTPLDIGDSLLIVDKIHHLYDLTQELLQHLSTSPPLTKFFQFYWHLHV